jgi:hypothetical protein
VRGKCGGGGRTLREEKWIKVEKGVNVGRDEYEEG